MRKSLLSFVVVSSLVLGACAHTAPVAQSPTPAPAPVAVAPAPTPAPPVEETPPVEEQAEAPAPVEEPTNFKGNGWELTLPSDGWHVLRGSGEDNLGLVNLELKNRIMLLTGESSLTSVQERDHHAAKLPQGLKVVPGSKKTVKSNGTTFASFIFKADEAPVRVWVWTTVQKGKSYTLLCGGLETSEKVQEKACGAVFKSLKVNGQ